MAWPPLEDEEAWGELVAWRHPEFNLNHLQIALLQKKSDDWQKLWNRHFLREELYRDEGGRLVNHPLHLYEILGIYAYDETGSRECPSVDHIRDELFFEEGLIDLTVSRLRRKSPRPSQGQSDVDTSPPTAGPGQSGTQGLPPEEDPHRSDKGARDQGEDREGQEERSEHVARSDSRKSASRTPREILQIHPDVQMADHPQTMRLQPFLVDGKKGDRSPRSLAQVIRKLCGPKGQASTADLLCSIIGNLGDFRCIVETLDYIRDASFHLEKDRDFFILYCQVLCAFESDISLYFEFMYTYFAKDLYMYDRWSVEMIQEGARFLPRQCVLEVMWRYRQLMQGRLEDPKYLNPVLEDRLSNWTLQDLCVMKILKCVRGDARKVWTLEGLPVPLQELFHVPFGRRCEELRDRQEEREAEEQE